MSRPNGRLVLIVDDNDLNRKLARDVLLAAGFRTLEASTAADALQIARERLPDLVLMDLGLPDADGADALRRLRRDARTSLIPVVALSAMRIDAGDRWLVDVGFAGYITKPIDTDTFPQLVERYSGGARD